MSFLLDTDTCSAHLKSRSIVFSRFVQHAGQLNLSVLTLGELLTWAQRANASPKRMQMLTDLLSDVRVVPIASETAEVIGSLRASLLDHGRPTPEIDLWIAATAICHDMTLVTHNARHFEHIPGLRITDWLTDDPAIL
jgi:predicted nucleic acid-binding protein